MVYSTQIQSCGLATEDVLLVGLTSHPTWLFPWGLHGVPPIGNWVLLMTAVLPTLKQVSTHITSLTAACATLNVAGAGGAGLIWR